MSLVVRAFFLASIASLVPAGAECQGAGCKVETPEDDVSLLQVALDVDSKVDPKVKNLQGEWNQFKADMDESMENVETTKDVESEKHESRDASGIINIYAREQIEKGYFDDDSFDSGAARVANYSTKGKCPFGPADGLGSITVGVIYNRKATVNKAIAKMFEAEKDAWYVKFVGKVARSHLLAEKAGASFPKVNEKIIEEATPLMVEGINAAHVTIVPDGNAACDPHAAKAPCPDKHGAVLLGFKVCGPSEAQKKCFRACNIFGDHAKDDSYTGMLHGWAKNVGNWLFDGLEPLGLKGVIGGQIVKGLVDALPGQLMAGLEEADVGQPNIVVWPEAIKADKMFHELGKAEQAKSAGPEPDCPAKGHAC